MAALSGNSIVSAKLILQSQLTNPTNQSSSFNLLPIKPKSRSIKPISAVHAAEPAKSKSTTTAASAAPSPTIKTTPGKWAIDSWRSKKALQLPEYPNQQDLDSVLQTLEAFPPIVFAGEARKLEDRLAEAAMGNAFLLQGGDCAESFKEFTKTQIPLDLITEGDCHNTGEGSLLNQSQVAGGRR